MVSLGSLWLPILLSAVAVFVASSVVWMLLPHHRDDFAGLPDEEAVRDALAAEIARGHGEVGHAHDHGRALAVLGHAQAVVDRGVAAGGVEPGGGAQPWIGHKARQPGRDLEALGGKISDYLTKPVAAGDLLAAIERALATDSERRAKRAEAAAFAVRLARLTPREREVLDAAIAGRMNKQIACDLAIVEKTVKVHRARVMRKMGASTFADLVTMVVRHRDAV